MDLNIISLGVSIVSMLIMASAIVFGAGKLKQSVVGIQKQQDAANVKLAEIDKKMGLVQTAVAKLQGFNEGVQEERNRQGP